MPERIDPLTGLLSMSALIEQLEAAVRENRSFVLVVMDLDHFKSFNDQYGHVAGDAWIRANAQLFQQAFQGEDNIVGRYGGDEFMAAVRTDDPAKVYEQAEALRQRVEKEGLTILVDGQPLSPRSTITLGLAAYPTHAAEQNELIEKGKNALYRAKISGGNRVCFYQETDLLTGLLTHFACERALQEAVVLARQKSDSVSLFLLDIDHFKEVNDEYGHRAGDEVLKRLAHILETNFKALGPVGRYLGDEFLVILPGQRADSAFILAEEVRRLVEDSEIVVSLGSTPGGTRSFTLRFHISGGIASFPGDAAESVDLLRKADEALYRSKNTGRNRISLPASAQMVTKTSYYTQVQLERLSALARKLDKTEAFLLREALDDLLRRYGEVG